MTDKQVTEMRRANGTGVIVEKTTYDNGATKEVVRDIVKQNMFFPDETKLRSITHQSPPKR
jgi:hypothetical protein